MTSIQPPNQYNAYQIHDISIHHSEADSDWAQKWLKPRLEKEGLKVSTASRGGLTGFFNRIRDISDNQFTLFVVTPAFMSSTVNQGEIKAAWGRLKAGAKPDSALLLLQPVELGEEERELPLLDFTTPENASQNLARLLEAFKRGEPELLRKVEPGKPPISQTIFQRPPDQRPADQQTQEEQQASAENQADNPTLDRTGENLADQTVVTSFPEENAPAQSTVYQQRPPVEASPSPQQALFDPATRTVEEQHRRQLQMLRERLSSETTMDPVFRQAIEDRLTQVEADLEAGSLDTIPDQLSTAGKLFSNWSSQAGAWQWPLAGLRDLHDQVQGFSKDSSYARWLSGRLEQMQAEAPGMESPEILSRQLEETSRQIARYRGLQQKIDQIQETAARVPPSKGFYPPQVGQLRRQLDGLTPLDEEKLQNLEEMLNKTLSDLSQRIQQEEPSPVQSASPAQTNMPATQQTRVDTRQSLAESLRADIDALRKLLSSDAELPEVFGAAIASELDAAEKSLAASELETATSTFNQARATWDKWNKERKEWLDAIGRFEELKRDVGSLKPDSSAYLKDIQKRLEELDLRSVLKRSPAEFLSTISEIEGQERRYQELRREIDRLEDEQKRLPETKGAAQIDLNGLRERLFRLSPSDDEGFFALRKEVEQAAAEVSERAAQVEKDRQAAEQPEEVKPPEDTKPTGDGQTAQGPAGPTAAEAEKTPRKTRKPRQTPVREVLREVHFYAPPAPPPADDCLTLEVSRAEVVLTLGNGAEYRSLNKLDHSSLEHEENLSPKQYGEKLFAGLIHDQGSPGFEERPTRLGYDAIKATAAGGMRIELRAEREHPLYQWELLKDPLEADPLAVNEHTPFFRLHSSAEVKAAEATPIRILFALCNPLDLGKPEYPPGRKVNPLVQKLLNLDLALERQIIQKAMEPLVKNNMAEYEILSGPESGAVSLDAIKEKLQEGYHVLHLLAHGVYVQRRQAFCLVLEDGPQRLHNLVSAEDFSPAVLGKKLRLVVLAACQSGSQDFGDPFQALAPRLVEKKIPAVIAMQSDLPIEAAQIFTQRFYGDLARSGRIDMAMAATRHDLYLHNPEGWTWGIPVLTMNTGEGRLFNVNEEHASTVERPKYKDLNIQGYDELGGLGDPAPRRLAQAIENDVRRLGFGQDSSLLSALRAVVAPSLANRLEPEEPLAKKQDRAELSKLERKVDIDARELKTHVADNSGIRLDPSAFDQIASALNAGKHIILIGPPGTGKTSLCQDVCSYAKTKNFNPGFVLSTASADWTTFDTIGGYVPTRSQTLQFRTGIFLEAISTGKWLVIDEINRAEIDKAFGELFTVLSGQEVDLPCEIAGEMVRVLPAARSRPENAGDPAYWVPASAAGQDYHYIIHPNWRIIGTMNVYDKSSLFQMSFAFMRRFAFIDVDLPPDSVCFELVDQWLEKAGDKTAEAGLPFDQLSQLQRQLRRLISRGQVLELQNIQKDNPIMERRALGPAIIKDMIEYIGDRRAQELKTIQEQELNDRRLVMEAFILYVIPQLDGLDYDGIIAIYQHIKTLFAGVDDVYREHILDRIRLLYPHIKTEEWDKKPAGAGN